MSTMAGYTKLFNSILASTIWREEKETKILWITMLAMADKDGMVEASIPGLADMARLTVKETQEALGILESPDEFSRTKDHDGRRIEPVLGGWLVLNHAAYRQKMDMDERREYLRLKKQESRERARQQSVNNCPESSTESTQAESRGQRAKADPEKRESKAKGTFEEVNAYCHEQGLPESDAIYMFNKWEADGWMNGRQRVRDWKATIRSWKAASYFPSQKPKRTNERAPTKLPLPQHTPGSGF